jgi:hypothetical protein
MKKLVLCVASVSALFFVAATPRKEPSTKTARIQRGAYLTAIAGCHDCHSPKSGPATMAPDMERLLSGRPSTTAAPDKPAAMGQISVSGDLTAWYGPWGVSYSANLTPDPETGLGKRYSEASFIRAMRTGNKPDGGAMLPPMPWPDFAKMTDEDLKSVWAYLQTLKPVKNFVRQATK